ncbi:NAD-dependent epimerase/dehydratase [Ferrimonas balearica DSM 9799]|uniref:NAD-dependent epimerase/dehydratase n=1 Tax=Ferrimonas balearica (strain DSM 9799 / CCM 4581 / KCTC 23876 / PAT) TaxID=550540 RepID=E1SMU8_FERBD|nr:SDR family oxidoreductase [Ferrimonas balearica]ADN76617.1 NAD-dependent epimerase/dehydratase [Ferrimonas balearica DSM 9799]
MQSLSIVGCGWLGLSLAEQLQSLGYAVRGCSRNPDTLAYLAQLGIPAFTLDIDEQLECDDLPGLLQAQVLFVNVPPGRSPSARPYAERMSMLAEAAWAHGIRRVVFVSSTAVYANGEQVDEQSALDESPRAAQMQEAEQVFVRRFGDGVTILRPAGLVGGERHPGRFLAGREGLPGAAAPVNLVHRDDVIGAVIRVLEAQAFGQVFNLSAPHHPSRGEFYPHAAKALGLEPPQFSDEPMAVKRVLGQRIVDQLGFSYRYPDPMTMPPLSA